jgi:hypothetical protein
MDGRTAFELFFCNEEDRIIVGGIDTYPSPDEDGAAICRHCDHETTEVIGTAFLDNSKREVLFPWVKV